MRIWKWPLILTDYQSVDVPEGSEILTVQVQHGNPQLWALCDEEETTMETLHIGMFGTGNPVPNNTGEYISTIQLFEDQLVFHVFNLDNVHGF